MAIGRGDARVRTIQAAPRYGPQSFTVGMLLGDVLAWTRGERAAELSVIPKRTHTFFGPYKPGTAQRIPPIINTGYGRNYATNSERIRRSLVARARMFKSAKLLGGQAAGFSDAPAAQAAAAAKGWS